MCKLIVKEDPNFVRDINSKAILNTNLGSLKEYKNNKNLKEEIKNLKTDILELKAIVSKILNCKMEN